MVQQRMSWRCAWASSKTQTADFAAFHLLSSIHPRQRRLRGSLLLAALVFGAMSATSFGAAQAQGSVSGKRYAERALYLDARDHLKAGRIQSFRRAAAALEAYPLAPYLIYQDMRHRLSRVSDDEMAQFLRDHGDVPIAPLLRLRWLKHLGASAQWPRFLAHYKNEQSTTLRCYYLRALYATGEREEAFAQVPEIWVAGKSLPKACDPIFDLWIDADRLTLGTLWERMSLALAHNQRTLARYLITLFPESHDQLGQLFYRVHRDPLRIVSSPLRNDTKHQRDIVLHALERLLRKDDVEHAGALWERYAGWNFTDEQRTRAQQQLFIARAKRGDFPARVDESLIDAEFVVAMSTAAVRNQKWHAAEHWIDQLDLSTRNEHMWQYWLARALYETEGDTSERAQLTLLALAEKRDYYGFLAAQHLDRPPSMNAKIHARDAAAIARLRQRSEVQRALELYAVREFIAARREWGKLLPKLDTAEQAAAAHLANEIGWPRQAIAAANVAGLRDALDLRFPLLHLMHYQRMSHATEVPMTLLLAISRQESAFDERARSSANARGLMQLLPSTAERVARGANLMQPTNTALYRPSTNIEIASHYIATLLERFEGSRPLAIAGYNAGEHRVDRWIKGMGNMPMDVWIERIPFKETRNYVKNVLAFVQVYNRKLDVTSKLLGDNELRVPGGDQIATQTRQSKKDA